MKILKTGSYLGAAKKTLNVNGLIVSDTEYRNKTHYSTRFPVIFLPDPLVK